MQIVNKHLITNWTEYGTSIGAKLEGSPVINSSQNVCEFKRQPHRCGASFNSNDLRITAERYQFVSSLGFGETTWFCFSSTAEAQRVGAQDYAHVGNGAFHCAWGGWIAMEIEK